MENRETSLILNVKNIRNVNLSIEKPVPKVFSQIKKQPNVLMKNLITAHIIIYPLGLLYLAIFYTMFLLGFRKCRYEGMAIPLLSFIVSDFILVIVGVLSLLSFFNRVLKYLKNALKGLGVGLVVKSFGWVGLWFEMTECFERRKQIINIALFSIVFGCIYFFFLYKVYEKIKEKPWKEFFLGKNH